MLISPQDVPDVSFQMSFSAVLALIAGYEALRPWLRRLHGASWPRRFASHLVALALTSALAGSASAPVWRLSFRPGADLFRPGQHGRGAVDRVVGNAGRPDRPVVDAAASGGAGSGADGLGRASGDLGRPRDRGIAGGDLPRPHVPAWGLCLFSVGLAWLGLWRTRRRLLGVLVMLAGSRLAGA